MDDVRERSLVRHAALDAFGHELLGGALAFGVLEIAVASCRAASRRASPCRDSSCTSGPGRARSRRAIPRCRRTGCRASPPTRRRRAPWRCRPNSGCRRRRSPERPCAPTPRQRICDRRDLRHADAGDDARRADRARTDADLDAVGAVVDERLGAARPSRRCRRSPAPADSASSPTARDRARPANGRATCRRRSRRRPPRPAPRRAASVSPPVPTAAPTRSRPRSSLHASGCSVAFRMSLTVMSPRSSRRVVDDEHALEAVPVHQRLRRLEIGAFGHRDELFALAS